MLTVPILIDDADERRHLVRGLELFSHRTIELAGWEELLEQVAGGVPDAVIVGAESTRSLSGLRAVGPAIPVLMLTDMANITQRIEGLEAGADDCLSMPFRFGALAARLESIVRRARRADSVKLRAGAITIDLGTREVFCGEQVVRLTRLEFAILEQLMQHVGRTMTRSMLLEKVWDGSFEPRADIVACHLARLGDKLRRGGHRQPIAVERDGYRLQHGR